MPDDDRGVAVVPRERIGDALIACTVAHNLARTGQRVTLVSTALRDLDAWFPTFDVRGAGELQTARWELVIHQNAEARVAFEGRAQRSIDWSEHTRARTRSARLDAYVDACSTVLGLADVVRDNGIEPPAGLARRAELQRVVVHPFSAEERKSWPLPKFVRLARTLEDYGFRPVFLSEPGRSTSGLEWGGCRVECFPDLAGVAHFLATSGYFIGNDSGIGHLASSLGLPTTTLAVRPNLARRWTPAWSPAATILPRVTLPTTFLKYLAWKRLVGVDDVVAGFLTVATQ